MAQPVVHVEIIGRDPERLRRFYGELFGWSFDLSAPVAEAISEPTNYGFVEPASANLSVPAGVGGGPSYAPQVVFYVGVPDVAAALAKAEKLGGARRVSPTLNPGKGIVVAQFTDPEGQVIGLAGPK